MTLPKNWKTSLAGVVVGLSGFVTFSPQLFPPMVVEVAKYIMAGGLAGIGLAAKDFNSHSTAAEVHAASDVMKVEGQAASKL